MGNAPAILLALRTFQFAVSSIPPGQAFSVQVLCFLDTAGFVNGKLARQLGMLLSGGHRLAAIGRLRVDNSRPGRE